MVNINYAELRFDHAVIFSNEDTVFVAARENGSARTRIFLIFKGDRVYTRNGAASSWEILTEEDTRNTLDCVYRAINEEGLPTYKLNGSSRTVTGHNITVN